MIPSESTQIEISREYPTRLLHSGRERKIIPSDLLGGFQDKWGELHIKHRSLRRRTQSFAL